MKLFLKMGILWITRGTQFFLLRSKSKSYSSLSVYVFQGLLVTFFFFKFALRSGGIREKWTGSNGERSTSGRNLHQKKKRGLPKNVMSSTPSSSPSVKYLSDGWGNSKKRMPSFTRIHSQVSLLKEKIPDLEKNSRNSSANCFALSIFQKMTPLFSFYTGFPNLKMMRALYTFLWPGDRWRKHSLFVLCKRHHSGWSWRTFSKTRTTQLFENY